MTLPEALRAAAADTANDPQTGCSAATQSSLTPAKPTIQGAAAPKADLRSQLRRLVRSAVIWAEGDYDRRAHAREIIDSIIVTVATAYRIPRRELELLLADREVLIAEALGGLVDVDDLLRTINSFEDDEFALSRE